MESFRREIVRPVRCHAKGELVLIRTVRGMKQVGLRLSVMKSHERKACRGPSDMRNQTGGTSSFQYVVARNEGLSSSVRYKESKKHDFACRVRIARKEGLSSSVRYEESSRQDFILPLRCCVNGDLVLSGWYKESSRRDYVCPVQSRTMRACPRLSSMKNQVGWTSSVSYEVMR